MVKVTEGGFHLNLTSFFLKESKPFTSKREVKWSKVYVVAGFVLFLVVVIILCLPNNIQEQDTFHEKAERGSLNSVKPIENDPSNEALKQFEESRLSAQQVHGSLDHLYREDSPSTGTSIRDRSTDRNSSMILSRGGVDSKNQLSPGTRLSITIVGSTTIANQGMPVIGKVSRDAMASSSVAIPSGSKVLGDASFDEEGGRVSINWRSIILTDGRERPLSAVAIDQNGQVGVSGNIQSDDLKNVMGQAVTRFVGAYAAGSMSSGMFGANRGGNANGIRNAIAQTATDRANALGENLQKERKWIDLRDGTKTLAVLNQPFSFRDAGSIYGK